MALVASNRHMPAFQRIFCGRVIFDSKRRWLEPFNRMAGGTFPAVGTGPELTFVRILVAVRALCKWHRRFEVSVCVAVGASHHRMLAKQMIFCLGVIESLQLSDLTPVGRVMTRLTRRCKTALVGIGMARRTLRKGEARIFHIRFCIGNGNVALRAGRLFVRSRERIPCLRMAEEGRGLPSLHGVAARAILPDLAAVLILMAAYTFT